MPMKRRHAVREHLAEEDCPQDIFLRSLDEITPEQLGGEAVKRRKTGRELVSYIIDRAVYFVVLAVFVICIIELVKTLTEQISGDKFYEEVLGEFSSGQILSSNSDSLTVSWLGKLSQSEAFVAGVSQPDPGITVEKQEYNEKVELLKAQVASFARMYPNTYAWIYIEDTSIDYPVMKCEDNDYYLTHTFDDRTAKIGSIFADFRLRDDFLNNYNIVIYGHRTSTKRMFGDVSKFAESEEFFRTHHIYVYTTEGLYEFEPFNISIVSQDYQYFRTYFADRPSFLEFANEMKEMSMYKTDVTFTDADRILTLSTCTYTGISTLRYCLQAKLIKIY